MENVESINWTETFNKIKDYHDKAFKKIEEAIKLEENENPQSALEKYKLGIHLIEEALRVPVECPENIDSTWEQATVMIQKMKKTRTEVLLRIQSVQQTVDLNESPPTYDEAMSSANVSITDRLRTHTDIITALKNDTNFTNSVHVIYSVENVKLYIISNDHSVVLNSELQNMTIGVLERGDNISITYLQVGEWIYPLIPSISPCFRTEWGAYIFPDLHGEPGSSVGIVIPPELDDEVYSLLQDILHEIIGEIPKVTVRTRSAGISGTISKGIVTGANFISQGLIRGAGKAGELLNYTTPKLINHLQPAIEAKPIPDSVQKTIVVAQTATSTAASVTGFIANKISLATSALGKYLAPHIEKQGTKILSSGFNMSENEASEKMSGILTVAAGAVEGFSIFYSSLENSASILGQSLSENTVKIVEHKYGHPSGVLATNSFSTVGNIINVSHNINYITPKGLAKSTAKEAGKAMVQDIRQEFQQPGPSNMDITKK